MSRILLTILLMSILVKPIPSFPPREVLYDYILGRIKKGNSKHKVKFSTIVTNVIHNGNNFEVTYRDKKNDTSSTDVFDYVVVANGHFSVPFIPEYPGMKAFPGRIMHSHDFRDAEEFREQKCCCFGK